MRLTPSIAFIALHSATPHKELRFLLPVIPVLCALAAIGVTRAAERIDAKLLPLGSALLVAAAVISGAQYQKLTFERSRPYVEALQLRDHLGPPPPWYPRPGSTSPGYAGCSLPTRSFAPS